jgi:hypothetical protein
VLRKHSLFEMVDKETFLTLYRKSREN